MSLKSKKTLIEVIISFLLGIGYLIYSLSSSAPGTFETASWAIAMLVTIGIGILAIIITEIAFHVVYAVVLVAKNEDNRQDKNEIKEVIEQKVNNAFKEDEMDKQIDLKVNMISYGIIGTVLLTALILLAFNVSLMIVMQMVFGGCLVGMMTDSVIKIIYYEKGFR